MPKPQSPIGTFTLDFTPLRMRRRALGITLRRLEAITGISYTSVWFIEHGHQSPTAWQLVALARALGVPVHELYSVREDRAKSA